MSKVERIKCGNGNCYLVSKENNTILVDTSRTKYKDEILELCRTKDVKLILLTHGHVDHIQNAAYLSKELNAPIAMHKADYALIKDNMTEPMFAHGMLGKLVLALSMKSFKEDKIQPFEPAIYVQEGDSLENYGIQAEIIELPGHTKGSIGLKVGTTDIIVGDALMNMFYPSKSMLYGNKEIMEKSAKKIGDINNVTVHFGHGEPITNRKW